MFVVPQPHHEMVKAVSVDYTAASDAVVVLQSGSVDGGWTVASGVVAVLRPDHEMVRAVLVAYTAESHAAVVLQTGSDMVQVVGTE